MRKIRRSRKKRNKNRRSVLVKSVDHSHNFIIDEISVEATLRILS